MVTPFDKLIERIEERKKQLDELLESYQAFRQKLDSLPSEIAQEARLILASEPSATNAPDENGKQDLAGKTAVECAMVLLKEREGPMHFGAIARESLQRGYKPRKTTGTAEEVENRVQHSFWAALSRDNRFKSVGNGRYQIVEKS